MKKNILLRETVARVSLERSLGMHFRLVDIVADGSRYVTYVFDNDGTFQLSVWAPTADLFLPYALYDIVVRHDDAVRDCALLSHATHEFSRLGVVTRRTRSATHIQSGDVRWMFPRLVCSLHPGTSVWMHVECVREPFRVVV